MHIAHVILQHWRLQKNTRFIHVPSQFAWQNVARSSRFAWSNRAFRFSLHDEIWFLEVMLHDKASLFQFSLHDLQCCFRASVARQNTAVQIRLHENTVLSHLLIWCRSTKGIETAQGSFFEPRKVGAPRPDAMHAGPYRHSAYVWLVECFATWLASKLQPRHSTAQACLQQQASFSASWCCIRLVSLANPCFAFRGWGKSRWAPQAEVLERTAGLQLEDPPGVPLGTMILFRMTAWKHWKLVRPTFFLVAAGPIFP